MLKQQSTKKIVNFLLSGSLASLINIGIIYFLIYKIGFDTPILRNIANFIAIEISLIIGFFSYKIWVWKSRSWQLESILLHQLPLYNLAAIEIIIIRVIVIFPLLNWLNINPIINTLVGIIIGAILN